MIASAWISEPSSWCRPVFGYHARNTVKPQRRCGARAAFGDNSRRCTPATAHPSLAGLETWKLDPSDHSWLAIIGTCHLEATPRAEDSHSRHATPAGQHFLRSTSRRTDTNCSDATPMPARSRARSFINSAIYVDVERRSQHVREEREAPRRARSWWLPMPPSQTAVGPQPEYLGSAKRQMQNSNIDD